MMSRQVSSIFDLWHWAASDLRWSVRKSSFIFLIEESRLVSFQWLRRREPRMMHFAFIPFSRRVEAFKGSIQIFVGVRKETANSDVFPLGDLSCSCHRWTRRQGAELVLVSCRIGHLHAFFLRWTPEREPESSSKSDQPVTTSISLNQIPRTPSHNQAKPKETPSAKGFVLLSNDDSESTEDYLAAENKTTPITRSRTPTSSSTESNKEQKKSHYLKRQNTLLKEWEVSDR